MLLDVALDDTGIRPKPSVWESAAMADTDTVGRGRRLMRILRIKRKRQGLERSKCGIS